jgi:hypothetical protein
MLMGIRASSALVHDAVAQGRGDGLGRGVDLELPVDPLHVEGDRVDADPDAFGVSWQSAWVGGLNWRNMSTTRRATSGDIGAPRSRLHIAPHRAGSTATSGVPDR